MFRWLTPDTGWENALVLRAALAGVGSFLALLLAGGPAIRWLGRRFREPIKSASDRVAELHRDKQATPTLGGLLIVAAIVAATALCGDLANPSLRLALAALLGLAAIGLVDDLVKLRTARRGLSGRAKLLGQAAVTLLVTVLLERQFLAQGQTPTLSVPGGGELGALGAWFLPLAFVVIVGSSNAVNLTDGLDGLAGGCLLLSLAVFAGLALVVGSPGGAAAWGLRHSPTGGELAIVLAAACGATLGFLWFNCHPAQVFMGDTGALSLGGLLGFAAVALRQELLLVVVGGVFVAETVSVIAQRGSLRLFGRRVLRCAPLHHHFQFAGWPEARIVVRFWIAAAGCGLLGIGCMIPRSVPRTDPAAAEISVEAIGAARLAQSSLPAARETSW